MTTFDDRQKAFENKYAHEEELAFKINARHKKLLGLWAAQKLGRHGDAAAEYAKDIVLADFDKTGDEGVVHRLVVDFSAAGLQISERQIRMEMERLMQLARAQVQNGEG